MEYFIIKAKFNIIKGSVLDDYKVVPSKVDRYNK